MKEIVIFYLLCTVTLLLVKPLRKRKLDLCQTGYQKQHSCSSTLGEPAGHSLLTSTTILRWMTHSRKRHFGLWQLLSLTGSTDTWVTDSMQPIQKFGTHSIESKSNAFPLSHKLCKKTQRKSYSDWVHFLKYMNILVQLWNSLNN